jgi:hypothetical protein
MMADINVQCQFSDLIGILVPYTLPRATRPFTALGASIAPGAMSSRATRLYRPRRHERRFE